MDKTEFLNQLRASLNGRMDAEEVADNLRYYEEYINGQLRLGRTESEVMASLGSPRLIARSITDATKVKERYENEANRSSEWQQGAWQQDERQQDERQGAWQQAGWKEDDQQSGWQRASWRQPKRTWSRMPIVRRTSIRRPISHGLLNSSPFQSG